MTATMLTADEILREVGHAWEQFGAFNTPRTLVLHPAQFDHLVAELQLPATDPVYWQNDYGEFKLTRDDLMLPGYVGFRRE